MHNIWTNLAFAALAIGIIVIGFRAVEAVNNGMKLSYDAKNHISSAFENMDKGDMEGALSEASKAKEDIEKLKILAQSWGQDISYLRMAQTNSKTVAIESLLDASYGTLSTLTNMDSEVSKLSTKDIASSSVEGKGSKIFINLKASRELILNIMNDSQKTLSASQRELSQSKKNLPKSLIEVAEQADAGISKALASIEINKAIFSTDLAWLSGEDGKEKNVLILFQNNAELRGGSGGSLGSFGTAKFKNGNLENIDFGQNIYKLDNPFRATSPFTPPAELQFLTGDKWVLKDAGWAVDGPESFDNIEKFYKAESGKSVDGVIMIDTEAIIELLKVIGPIEMPAYGKIITADNFRAEIEEEVHESYFNTQENLQENEPKKILSDMMPLFMGKLFDSLGDETKALKTMAGIAKSFKSKDIVFHFNNSDFQNRLKKINLTGSINPAIGDYMHINNSNIGGAKTSVNITQKVNISVNIKQDGSLKNELILKRTYDKTLEPHDEINKNFTRMLIPDGSKVDTFEVIDGNFEQIFTGGYKDGSPYWIGKEAGKTEINFWMNTEPQKSASAKIIYYPNYKLSMGDSFNYEIFIQKQSGAPSDTIELTINYPDGYKPANVTNFDARNHTFTIKTTLDTDKDIIFKFVKD